MSTRNYRTIDEIVYYPDRICPICGERLMTSGGETVDGYVLYHCVSCRDPRKSYRGISYKVIFGEYPELPDWYLYISTTAKLKKLKNKSDI